MKPQELYSRLENRRTALALCLPILPATVVFVLFVRSCENDCGDAGGRWLFFMWLATLPGAAAAAFILLRTWPGLTPGLFLYSVGLLGQLAGYGFLALSMLPLALVAYVIFHPTGTEFGHFAFLLGVGVLMAVGSIFLALSGRSVCLEAERARMGRPWGV